MRYPLIRVAIAAGFWQLHRGTELCAAHGATPANFRAPEPLPPPQAASLADLKWFEVFKDENCRS
jgi:hypothetical protein